MLQSGRQSGQIQGIYIVYSHQSALTAERKSTTPDTALIKSFSNTEQLSAVGKSLGIETRWTVTNRKSTNVELGNLYHFFRVSMHKAKIKFCS